MTDTDTDADTGEPFRTLLTPITLRTAGERIAERIVTAIALGELVPDHRLPTERELAGARLVGPARAVGLPAPGRAAARPHRGGAPRGPRHRAAPCRRRRLRGRCRPRRVRPGRPRAASGDRQGHP